MKENIVMAEIALSKDETRELGGEMDDIVLFTQARAKVPARISLRGKNEATKYFLIPRQLRKSLNLRGSVTVQRLQRAGRDIFIYAVEPDDQRRSFVVATGSTA